MYVTDEFGHRYDHIALDGVARDGGSALHGETITGTFLFPPAQAGAREFTFYDGDQNVSIPGIRLTVPSP